MNQVDVNLGLLGSDEQLTYTWLDCDPGHDDACAILLASFSRNIKIIGISTVAGNQTIEKTTKNALNVLNLLGHVEEPKVELSDESIKLPSYINGLAFPLIQGSRKPLLRKGVICDEIHGESGLETHSSVKLPEIPPHAIEYVKKLNSQPFHFSTLIYQYIKSSPQPVTLIATGPLTNVALLLINHPESKNYIEKIVLMGGACGVGNTGPVAEFNIQVDPEAAHCVFESGIPIYMVPLQVTHCALVTDSVLESIGSLSTNFSQIIIDLLMYFKTTYKSVFRMDHPPLHDPCAVAFVINPSIFEHRKMRVDIETSSPLSYGQTVCDIFDMSSKPKNVHVCLKIDVNKFWDMMIEAVRLADAKTKVNR